MSEPTKPARKTDAVRAVTALLPRWSEWKPALRAPGADLLAGLIVALVALPLALGFGVSTGLGAAAGLTTAIIAGVVAAVFGGSRFQVSGPTGAMTVVLVPIVAEYGPTGVLAVGLMAGVILLALEATLEASEEATATEVRQLVLLIFAQLASQFALDDVGSG